MPAGDPVGHQDLHHRDLVSLVEAHLEQFDDEADEADQALDAEVVPE